MTDAATRSATGPCPACGTRTVFCRLSSSDPPASRPPSVAELFAPPLPLLEQAVTNFKFQLRQALVLASRYADHAAVAQRAHRAASRATSLIDKYKEKNAALEAAARTATSRIAALEAELGVPASRASSRRRHHEPQQERTHLPSRVSHPRSHLRDFDFTDRAQ
ncbi:uncharacterized protein AMSG_09286 [Thecamonas trahens ATCC 50062]|uniref:Uncharacterized protein n=1 Tax=Thecamonas trahens ATCC 50062 TaxID=461836 RepID=A0A0L0DLL7_THETB|nr:hypothetical protein AMSG_09286 [Thecamonas trahens ATCC 50062]KNC53202.1 hypothetical protein AMSG_09286 [Thecamonas trahens ATCC 50062]|eukprot:XP_013754672.1 hypothetical protein AMSG_09286 [Thecamonas trahens ATCC 50062]